MLEQLVPVHLLAKGDLLGHVVEGMAALHVEVSGDGAEEALSEHGGVRGLAQQTPLEESIYFSEFPGPAEVNLDQKVMEKWSNLIRIRSEITKALEIARREKVIGHPLEAEVLLKASGKLYDFLKSEWTTVKDISIISKLSELQNESVEKGVRYTSEEIEDFIIQVQPAPGEKCTRCWIRSTTVGKTAEHPEICSRCAEVMIAVEAGA